MDDSQAIEYLNRDGNLEVPCSRYGWDTFSCSPVALSVAHIFEEANGEEITEELLEDLMGLVVNDSASVAELLAAHGTAEEREEWAEYAEDDQ
jgi:hypothetical protein